MADDLSADLRLEFGDAVDALDAALTGVFDSAATAFGEATTSALTDALSAVSADDVTIPVGADATDAFAAVDDFAAFADSTDPTANLSADPTDAESVLDQFAALADATDPTAHLELDTADAETALADVSTQAESAGGSLDGASTAAAGFSSASDLATGSAAGLGSAIGDTSKGAGLAVGAIAAVGAGIGLMFGQAVDAQAALQRFGNTFGSLAPQIEQVDVGNLNSSLSDLALKLGSDDDALRQAASSFGQLGHAAGAADKDVAQSSEEIVALSLRAVALKPSLGDAATVAESMGRALSRGGRFAANFGIDVSAAEISARALADTGKATAAELTFYEKAAAGAALATEKYGSSLQGVVNTGAQNAQITLARLKQTIQENLEALGKPLVAPIFALLERSIPIAQAAGTALSKLGQSALPVVISALDGLLPILQLATDLLNLIPAPVIASVGSFLLLAKATVNARGGMGTLLPIMGALLPLLNAVSPEVGTAAVNIGGMAFAGSKLAGVIPRLTPAMGGLAGAGIAVGQAIGGTEGNIVSFGAAGAALGSVIPGVGTVIGGLAGAAAGAATALLDGGESVDDYRTRITKLADALKGLSTGEATRGFIKALGDTDRAILLTGRSVELSGGKFGTTQSKVRALSDEFKAFAAGSPAEARDVLQGLHDQGLLTNSEFERLSGVVNTASAAFADHATKARDVNAADQELAGGQAAATAAVTAFAQSAVAQLPTADSALAATTQALGTFGVGLDNAASPEVFLAKLNETIAGIANFQTNLQTAVSGGFTNVALFVAQQGPVVGGAYLTAFNAASPAVQQATDDALGNLKTTSAGFQAFLEGPLAGQISTGSTAAFQQMVAAASFGGVGATGAINAAAPNIAGAAAAAGGQASNQFGTGVAPIPGLAGTAVGGAGGSITSATGQLNGIAQNAGYGVGVNFGHGIANGIESQQGVIEAAARAVVHAAVVAADHAGSPSEHLFYDVAKGWPDAMADAMADSASSVVEAAQQIVRDAAAAAERGVELPLSAGASAGVSASVAAGLGGNNLGGGDTNVQVTVDIDIHGDVDAGATRQIREAVGAGVRDGLDGATRRRLSQRSRQG